MLKQVSDLLIDLFAVPCCLAGRHRRRTPAAEFRFGGSEFLADFGHRPQHRLGQFLDDVKLAELVRNIPKNLGNRLWIQGRAIGRDAAQRQFTLFQCGMKRTEKRSMSACVGSWPKTS